LLNAGKISEIGGMVISYKVQPVSNIEQLTQLMAGEADVDVYLGYSTTIMTPFMMGTGFYTPLNGSGAIGGYLDNCFDRIADAARLSSGDIWMLPLYAAADVLWYVPENFERFGLTPGDSRYFDGFVETVKRLNAESREYAAFVDRPFVLMRDLQYQYDMTCNDFAAKKADYNTDLFMRMFTTIYENYPDVLGPHPLFRNSRLEWDRMGFVADMPNYNKNVVIFKQEYIDKHLDDIKDPLDGWRVLPLPRVSEDVQGNIVYLQYAVINPLSRNKDAAMKLLETIAANPLETIRERCFLIEDPGAYRDYYDISQPGFHDLLQLFHDSMVVVGGYASEDKNYADEYQAGRLTAEEAIMTLQREVEIWLNE
jgi:ABC-type glycerol-3-phosphate transport system substrate-binding protein